MEAVVMMAFAVLLFFGIWVLSGWLIRGTGGHHGSHPA
jgi:hypothetical protein